MKFTTWTHVEGREVFDQIKKQFGKDIEGEFNESFTVKKKSLFHK